MTKTLSPLTSTLIAAALLGLGSAQAHVVLQERSAPAGSAYKAVFNVTHGCDGSAVIAVTVTLPTGFRGAKPMPKAGWALTVSKTALDMPYTSHGRSVTEDVTQVRWAAQSKEAWLQDAWFDEFVLRGQLPDQPGPLWFRVRQDCEQGSIDWAEMPHHGTSTQGLTAPAALLEVVPASARTRSPANEAAGQHRH